MCMYSGIFKSQILPANSLGTFWVASHKCVGIFPFEKVKSQRNSEHHYDDVKWIRCQNEYTPIDLDLSTSGNWFFIITRYYIK